MNPIKLYYLSFENIKKYFSSIEDKNKSLIFNRVPVLNKIHASWLQSIIYKVCIVLEPLVSLLVVTVLLIPYCFKAIFTKKQPLSNELYIDNCPLLKGRTIAAEKYEVATDWLYSFDVAKKDWDKAKRCHSIFEFVSGWDVIKAYYLSVCAILGAQTKLKFKYVFRTFNSFEFFLMYYVLQNISPEITLCFCNQIDRYAILFDHAPQKNRALFQHGIEMPYADWPVKLEHTDTVYVLSKEETKNLFKAAFKVKPTHIYQLKPTIELTKLPDDNNFKILIVGFPGYLLFDKEKAIVKAFAEEGYSVYLKPHPGKEDMTKYKELADAHKKYCKLILEKKFPDVDVICSYRSTLAVEYQAHGKFVMMYDDYSVENMIQRIKDLKEKKA